MRLVLDTDVLVSAPLVGDGAGTAPRGVLRPCPGEATPLMAAARPAEYEDVLGREELFERSLAPRALTEHDLEARFRARAARGDRAAGLALLDRLDAAEAGQGSSP